MPGAGRADVVLDPEAELAAAGADARARTSGPAGIVSCTWWRASA
ncbi:hypothetical protein ACFPK1_22815 [Actinomycetospora rhizophila]|uniref:Uncharacterized protein n=1 Tax=Actinomycetospora rhizophila TaxID=1416876 RepID=A0ABV9ZHS5_9PSEU